MDDPDGEIAMEHVECEDFDDEEDDDDELMNFNAPFSSSVSNRTATANDRHAQKPTPDFQWDDEAIIRCFNLSVRAHTDGTSVAEWHKPPRDTTNQSSLQDWDPKELPKPFWAKPSDTANLST